ncbi:MAG TPA: hypothetical protein VFM55_11850, partial [Micromonosporaceae bacterium]|nr:hypothetical protein [Micromonosporaceae bacterium]
RGAVGIATAPRRHYRGSTMDPRVRRKQALRAVAVAVVLQLVGNLGGIVIGFVTAGSVSPVAVALTVVGVSVVSGLAVALLPRAASAGQPAHEPPSAPSRPSGPPSGPSRYPGQPRRTPAHRSVRTVSVTAVVLILFLCGGLGTAVTYGVQRAVGEIRERIDPGSEPGEQRLVRPATASAGNLTLTVSGVEVTSRVTKVKVTAANRGDESITLPLFGNCTFSVGGQTLQAAAQHSDWATTIGADAQVTGVIVFTGTPPATAATASLTFARVFVLGGGSITVRRVELKASVTDR